MKKIRVIYWVFQFAQIMALVPFSSDGRITVENKRQITIVIEPVYNGQRLKLKDQYYLNQHGDTIYIDLLRFYITNLRLLSADDLVSDSSSHLVDASDDASKTFKINNALSHTYSTLKFTVGVDSIANTSGANGGDLDPERGMYWAWNTGYIMAKLEGRSKVCKTVHHAFEFHIGGYLPPWNAAREVTIVLPHAVILKNDGSPVIRLQADVAAWFKGNIDLSKTNSVLTPGREANIIADNYAQMFSVVEISD